MYRWNDEKIRQLFKEEMKKAMECFIDEELDRLDLSWLSHKTKSGRIYHLISMSYIKGKLLGILSVDRGDLNTDLYSYKWNNEGIKKHFYREMRYARERYLKENIEPLDISGFLKLTKSARIKHMISLAFTLGKLKGIQSVDEGKTLIVLR